MSEDIAGLRAELDQLRSDLELLSLSVYPRTEPVALPGVPVAAPSAANHASGAATGRAWRTMSAGRAAAAWDTLTDYVDWLTARYQLDDTLPACWYRHGPLVEELDALRLAWTAAYTHPNAKPVDPAIWHQLLARVRSRLREWDRHGCALGTHRDTEPPSPDPDALAGREDYIHADVQRRARHDGAVHTSD